MPNEESLTVASYGPATFVEFSGALVNMAEIAYMTREGDDVTVSFRNGDRRAFHAPPAPDADEPAPEPPALPMAPLEELRAALRFVLKDAEPAPLAARLEALAASWEQAARRWRAEVTTETEPSVKRLTAFGANNLDLCANELRAVLKAAPAPQSEP